MPVDKLALTKSESALKTALQKKGKHLPVHPHTHPPHTDTRTHTVKAVKTKATNGAVAVAVAEAVAVAVLVAVAVVTGNRTPRKLTEQSAA